MLTDSHPPAAVVGTPLQDAPDIFGRAFQVKLKERLLRDPLHGLIAIDEGSAEGRLLVQLIDSAEFQRLRRIRQLGLSHYAYPGAEHSRFTHGIGAFHLMRTVTAQLGRMYTIDSELSFYAEIAALVHDVGHGPFSHVSESIFGRPHEAWTIRILHDPRTEIHQALSGYDPRLPSIIESMLSGMAKPGYLASLVSSQLDTDRFDYLLRDSLMTGVKYGIFDLDRMIHMLRISPDGEKIVVADGGLGPIEKYVQARYHMYRQVYLHKTAVAAEAMLEALLRRARTLLRAGTEIDVDPAGALGRALATPDELTVADYLDMDDILVLGLIKRWARGADADLGDLSRRLLARRLFKTLEIDPAAPDFPECMARARREVEAAGLNPDYALLRSDASHTPYVPYDPTGVKTIDHIYIEDGRGGIVDVARVSPTIQAFTRSAHTLSRLVFPESSGAAPLREKIAGIFARKTT